MIKRRLYAWAGVSIFRLLNRFMFVIARFHLSRVAFYGLNVYSRNDVDRELTS